MRPWLVLLLGVAFLQGCGLVTKPLVYRSVAATPRDPLTGVVEGAEARTLSAEGATSAVLMIHGFVGDGRNFADLPERIAEAGFSVRVLRLPGHGTDPREFARVTPEELLAHVEAEAAALAALGFEEVVLLGQSMGASLAILAASRTHGDRLILLAPYFGVTGRWWLVLPVRSWNALLGPFFPFVPRVEALVAINRREASREVSGYRWTPTAGVRTLMEIGDRASDGAVLNAIGLPVLWLHSPGDSAADYQLAARAVGRMEQARVTTASFPASDHALLLDYDREAVKQCVLDFLLNSRSRNPQ